MKWYVLVILICVSASVAGVALLYRTRNVYLPRSGTLRALSQLRTRFTTNRAPLKRFSIDDLPQAAHAAELLDPRANLPQTHRFPSKEIKALFEYSESCNKKLLRHVSSPELRKTAQWHRFLCGQSTHLPKRFFASPPYLHPSGRSFASLAHATGRPEFDETWLAAHRDYFHIGELPRGEVARLPPLQELVSGLGPHALGALLKEEDAVQSENYVIFRDASSSTLAQPASFAVYELSAWNAFLAPTPYSTSPLPSSHFCLSRTGNLCWHANEARWRGLSRLYTLLTLGGLGGIALTALAFLLQRRRARKVEEQARLFHLQMLTHELRTPATVLSLSLEGLRRDFDRLPPTSQRSMLRMCDELQRIERLVEASSRYLKTDGPHFQYVTLPSVNDFLSGILEKYADRVTWRPAARDTSFSIAPYWLELCLSNLVDNALRHGTAPVEVRLEASGKALQLSVSDAGTFTKTSASAGLGLGLSLVRRIVKAMQGKLSFEQHPTTFSIHLRAPA